ncbi:ADP-ribosyltransferase [Photorhabdus viridis]|uniref:ADP-ribosyltransferase n=1 Tax=Photorhabdus viridis TaxID=3163327 RepID=UPI00330715B0
MVNVNDLKKMFENSSQGKKSTNQLMTPKKLEKSNITSPLELNKLGNSEVKKSEKNNKQHPENINVGLKVSGGGDLEKWMQSNINIYNQLSEENRAAIQRYTGGKYRVYNEKLRSGKMFVNIRKSLDEVITALGELPDYSGEVYRGAALKKDIADKLKVGDIIFDPAFLSTSVDKESAEGFLKKSSKNEGDLGYFMSLNVIHGKSLMDPNLTQFSESEAEVLLLPGTKIEITNIEFKNSNIYIYGKEIESTSQTPINIYNGV